MKGKLSSHACLPPLLGCLALACYPAYSLRGLASAFTCEGIHASVAGWADPHVCLDANPLSVCGSLPCGQGVDCDIPWLGRASPLAFLMVHCAG